MVSRLILRCVFVTFFAVSVSRAQDGVHTEFAPPAALVPAHAEIVRSVSRSVLQARNRPVENAEVMEALTALNALAHSIDTVLAPTSNGIALEREAAPQSVARASRVDAARRRVDELRARHRQLRTQASRGSNAFERQRLTTLATKASELEQEAATALAASGSEQIERLVRVRERLQRQSLGERLNTLRPMDDEAIVPTPTLSTLTEHR